MLWEEVKWARYAVWSCIWDEEDAILVVIHGWAKIPCVYPSGSPWCASLHADVYESACAWWGHWEFITIIFLAIELMECWFVGSILDLWIMFNLVAGWFANWSHNCVRHWLSVDHKPLMKWFLNVWMARSAALTRWLVGSTNCYLQFFERRYFLRGVTAWFSVTLKVGLCPFPVNSLNTLSDA